MLRISASGDSMEGDTFGTQGLFIEVSSFLWADRPLIARLVRHRRGVIGRSGYGRTWRILSGRIVVCKAVGKKLWNSTALFMPP